MSFREDERKRAVEIRDAIVRKWLKRHGLSCSWWCNRK